MIPSINGLGMGETHPQPVDAGDRGLVSRNLVLKK